MNTPIHGDVQYSMIKRMGCVMAIFNSSTKITKNHIRNLKFGVCIALISVATLTNTNAQAGRATSTLTLSLKITPNSNGCGIGTVGSATPGATTTSAKTDGTAKFINHAFSGSNGIPVYCTGTFFVSADSGNNGHSYTDAAPTRWLYSTTLVQSYKYILTLGPTAPTSLSGTGGPNGIPIWSGQNNTSCQVAYVGGTGPGTGPTPQTSGCYKSAGGPAPAPVGPAGPPGPGPAGPPGPGPKPAPVASCPAGPPGPGPKPPGPGPACSPSPPSTAANTTTYIPWGYYIQGNSSSPYFTAGTYTDTVYLSLNY